MGGSGWALKIFYNGIATAREGLARRDAGGRLN